jgi:hypothetical protein
VTIAQALKYLAPTFDPINRARYEKIADRVDSLHPWERVRWATLLQGQRDHLNSVSISIPTPDEAIAFFRSHKGWQRQLSALQGEWSLSTRDWAGGWEWGACLLCLAQWQSEILLYEELIEILSTGGVPTPKQVGACFRGFDMDRDLLELSQLDIPLPSVVLARIRDSRAEAVETRPSISYERRGLWVAFPYDAMTVGKLRGLQQELGLTKSFDSKSKRWRFPLSAITALVDLLPEATLDDQSAKLLEEGRSSQSAQHVRFEQARRHLAYDLPCGLSLLEHQRSGAAKMLEQPMIVADDMGLGKTIMSLSAARCFQVAFGDRVLVLSPSSLRDNWQREADRVGVEVEIHSWSKVPDPPETPYVLIADEAHYAKSGGKTQRGQRFLDLALSQHCVVCWPLTGTPMKNGLPIELLPLLQAIRHPLAQNPRAYEIKYCDGQYRPTPGRSTRHWWNKGARGLDELSRLVSPYMLRRKKEDCLDLPPKTRVIRPVEVSGKALDLYQSVFARLQAEHHARIQAGEIQGDPTAAALVELGQLRQAVSMAKTEAAIEIAEEVVAQGHSIVLFTDFVPSAKRLANLLVGQGLTVDLLTGETPAGERQAIVDRFQSGATQVFVGTIKAGGVGLTLTRSSTVVLVDRPWSPGDAVQAEDRCYRIGTTSNVLSLWLQFGPIDERVDDVLSQKSDRIELVLQGKRKTLRGVKDLNAIALELATDIFGKNSRR